VLGLVLGLVLGVGLGVVLELLVLELLVLERFLHMHGLLESQSIGDPINSFI